METKQDLRDKIARLEDRLKEKPILFTEIQIKELIKEEIAKNLRVLTDTNCMGDQYTVVYWNEKCI